MEMDIGVQYLGRMKYFRIRHHGVASAQCLAYASSVFFSHREIEDKNIHTSGEIVKLPFRTFRIYAW